MVEKRAFIFVGLLILSLAIVFAAITTTTSNGLTMLNISEDVSTVYNITVSNTNTAADSNISSVFIVIPNSFTITNSTNGTSGTTLPFESSVMGTNIILNWTNVTYFAVNNNTETSFWFNLTAATPGYYNMSVRAQNETGIYETNITLIVNDTTIPSTINYVGFTPANNSNLGYSSIYVNVSVTDNGVINTIRINLLNSTFDIVNWTNVTGDSTSWTMNISGLADGVYYVNATVNDTANNINRSLNRKFTIDTTAPTVAFSCTPNSISAGGTITCTCTGADGGSGVATTLFNSTPSTSTAGTYSEYCIVTDSAGNSVTSSVVTNTVIGGGGSPPINSGENLGVPTSIDTNVWSKVEAGKEIIITNLDTNSGIKEIKITPNAEVNNVKMVVKGYAEKPLGVSVEKNGLVYKYFEIDAPLLVNKIQEAKIQIKVEKSFSDKDLIGLYKFNEAAEVWNELETVFVKEEGEFYYYEAMVDSFSYFAISEKSQVESGGGGGIVEKNGDIFTKGEEGRSSLWGIWATILVVVVIIISLVIKKRNNKI